MTPRRSYAAVVEGYERRAPDGREPLRGPTRIASVQDTDALHPCRVATIVVPERIPEYAAYDAQHLAELVSEHEEYVAALRTLGFQVMTFDNDPEWPASIFPEDPAVVIDANNVVITVPGADHRYGENERMAEFFRTQFPDMRRHEMRFVEGATLDGGDVLRIGRHLYIGLSNATNRIGANYLARVARGADLIPHITWVTRGLHLKSSCTLAAANRVFYDPHLISERLLRELATRHVCDPVEHFGSNVLYLGRAPATGNECALVSKTAPATAQKLRDLGLEVIEVEKRAHEQLDGRVTCSSVRIPEQGNAWCT